MLRGGFVVGLALAAGMHLTVGWRLAEAQLSIANSGTMPAKEEAYRESRWLYGTSSARLSAYPYINYLAGNIATR